VLKTFSLTDIGKKRSLNQDYVFTSETAIGNLPNLFIVADGMGGANAGDFASKYTVEVITEEIAACKDDNLEEIIRKAVTTANQKLRQKAMELEELSGMGTTVVVATCQEKLLTIANVGDSRLYIVNEEISQITKDHSLVEEMVRLGGLSKELARSHPDKNIITRAIGATDDLHIDFFTVNIKKGDIILLCSDGLTNMLEDHQIHEILKSQASIARKAEQLIEAANSNGGRDNIAVILIEPFA
jgi:PPM family protein phosphatase